MRKGQQISIQINSKTLKISATGECLEDGYVGDLIKVKVSLSGKELACKVTGVGKVEIPL